MYDTGSLQSHLLGGGPPLPSVLLMGQRSGGPSWRSNLCAEYPFSAPAVLLGPLQCLTFLLNHGLLAASLGAFWSVQAHWALSVPAAALVRVGGQLAYIALTSWTINENLFALLMSNVYSLLVRAGPTRGICLAVSALQKCTTFTGVRTSSSIELTS